MKSITSLLVAILVSMPFCVDAIELDITNHFSQLGGLQKDHTVYGTPDNDLVLIKKLMEKYFISNWEDKNISVQVGLANDSIFLLINNKTKKFIQYKFEVTATPDKSPDLHTRVLNSNSWFDLAPDEIDHRGGGLIYFDKESMPKRLNLNILSREKSFKSDMEKRFAKVIYSNGSAKSISLLGGKISKKTVIFPHYEKYRHDPRKTEEKSDLKKVDTIIALVGKKRNQIRLEDVSSYLRPKYHEKIMGIYDRSNNRVIVTTGATMPTTKLVKFNHPDYPNSNYYFYSEYIGDYAGELIGAAYSLLFSVTADETKILYEKQTIGPITTLWVDELVFFSDIKGLFVIGGKNNGVASFSFIGKLQDEKFAETIYFNYAGEEDHELCPENPFFLCG